MVQHPTQYTLFEISWPDTFEMSRKNSQQEDFVFFLLFFDNLGTRIKAPVFRPSWIASFDSTIADVSVTKADVEADGSSKAFDFDAISL